MTTKTTQTAQNQTVSKAEMKRINDKKQTFTNLLNRNLIQFKNLYLKNTVEFGIKLESITHHKFIEKIKGGKMNEVDKKHAIQYAEQTRKPEMIQTLEYINDANQSFNNKIEKMVGKMIDSNITTRFFRIEKITGGTPYDFAFLISDDTIEIHARVIYACGEINAPHFRFITTTRNK